MAILAVVGVFGILALFVCSYVLEYDIAHILVPYLQRIARAQEKLAGIPHPDDEGE